MAKEKTGVLTGIYNKGSKRKLPKIYITWTMMKQRCFNKNHMAYHRYGGRGITVCDRWMKFKNFYKDMNDEMEKHIKEHGKIQTTLDRIDNNGNYEPKNCKLATRREQGRNMRVNKFVEIDGVTKIYRDWIREGKGYLANRVCNGWSSDELKTEKGVARVNSLKKLKAHKEFFEDFDYSFLDERCKQVIDYRFGFNGNERHILKETGEKFNFSKARAGQIIKRSMELMAERVDKQ